MCIHKSNSLFNSPIWIDLILQNLADLNANASTSGYMKDLDKVTLMTWLVFYGFPPSTKKLWNERPLNVFSFTVLHRKTIHNKDECLKGPIGSTSMSKWILYLCLIKYLVILIINIHRNLKFTKTQFNFMNNPSDCT